LTGIAGQGGFVALLIWGLILFIGIHVVPSSARLRAVLAAMLGENGYKILFSLVSAVGLVLTAIGYGQAPREQIFEPSQTARSLLPAGMAVAFVLVVVANVPGRIRRLLRHPMLAGVLVWSVLHLLANGDLASNVLFSAFALWTVFAILSAEYRGKRPAVADGKLGNPAFDLAGVAGGLLAFWLVLHFHADLFGVAPV
jgi:uncharacterized membrane protein